MLNKVAYDMLSRFDTIPERDRRTDGQKLSISRDINDHA